jgi:hypothetical protein
MQCGPPLPPPKLLPPPFPLYVHITERHFADPCNIPSSHTTHGNLLMRAKPVVVEISRAKKSGDKREPSARRKGNTNQRDLPYE